jgi:hypothetical protein
MRSRHGKKKIFNAVNFMPLCVRGGRTTQHGSHGLALSVLHAPLAR